jgi:hypothetical protein
MAMEDAELKAEYAYLIRGFLRLARQFEQDRETKPFARSPKSSIFTSKSSWNCFGSKADIRGARFIWLGTVRASAGIVHPAVLGLRKLERGNY